MVLTPTSFIPPDPPHHLKGHFWQDTRLKAELLGLRHPLLRHVDRTDFTA